MADQGGVLECFAAVGHDDIGIQAPDGPSQGPQAPWVDPCAPPTAERDPERLVGLQTPLRAGEDGQQAMGLLRAIERFSQRPGVYLGPSSQVGGQDVQDVDRRGPPVPRLNHGPKHGTVGR
jgi:hypothetical protein